MVIYESSARWVAQINLAVAATGAYLSWRFAEGGLRYFMAAFCALFSLFWIRPAVFGVRLKLVSDGTTLQWQEGKQTGAAALKQIQKISVREEIKGPADSTFMWTYIILHMSDGKEQELPPNLATGLRCKNWRFLRRLVAHVRTVSPITVVSLNNPPEHIQGLIDERLIEV